jgi:hypothetical protein
MEVELPARMEQERIYRANQEQLKLKLEQSRDKFKRDWELARQKMEEDQRLVKQAQDDEAMAETKLTDVSNKNQEIQVQVKDTEKMLRATEGLVSLLVFYAAEFLLDYRCAQRPRTVQTLQILNWLHVTHTSTCAACTSHHIAIKFWDDMSCLPLLL